MTYSVTYTDLNRLSALEELQLQVLKARRKVLAAEHPDTLRSMANLTVTYTDLNRLSEAEECFSRFCKAKSSQPAPHRVESNIFGTEYGVIKLFLSLISFLFDGSLKGVVS